MRWTRQVAVLILCGLPFGPALAADPPQADLAAQAFDRGMADTKAGKFETAIKEFDEAIRLNPNTPGPYNTLAQILRQTGELDESKRLFAEGARIKQAKEAEMGSQLRQK